MKYCANPWSSLVLLSVLVGFTVGLKAADHSVCAPSGESPVRERLSLNEGWRFTQGDPAGNTTCLLYDVRPEVANARDDKAADSKPEEAQKLDTAGLAVLKPWILPSGNAFLKDPAGRHLRPAGDPGAEVPYVQATFDDSAWRCVDLPHDWAIEGPFLQEGDFGGMGRLPSWGVAWYRRSFTLPQSDAGRSVFLEVEGAMSYASVWLNGHLVGGWPYGYSSWQLDLTPYLNLGAENQLAIRLDNPPSSSRWYPGGGLYRNVWLNKTASVHVGQWGTFVSSRAVSADQATIDLQVNVDNDGAQETSVRVESRIYLLDTAGKVSGDAVAEFEAPSLIVSPKSSAELKLSTVLSKPLLWGPPPTQTPNRYGVVTRVLKGDCLLDEYLTPFGVRSLTFDGSRGLLVNGEPIKLKGVNMHHDLGSLGAAFNVRAAERQLEMLRELGCNAVRMSHNPPAPELLELTDRMGFLVMDEAFDCWERKKTPLDFHLIFPDWHEQDLRALVRRDRNHPSVIIWSVGNEVGEQYTDAAGAAIARRLCTIVHEEDPTRPTTSAMNFAKSDFPLPAELDVISLNYQGEGIRQDPEFEGTERIRTVPQYNLFHAKFPEKLILGSETASAFSSRGIYLFPVSKEISAPVRDDRGGDSKNHHVTAYELHAVDFGSSAEKVFGSLEKHPFVAGEFVWTGWDHLGEPTPYYSSRSAYAGIIDLAGFRKDRFYLYQSHWRPEFPMAHLLPHWNWPERVGLITPVHVFTSGDEGELFLNGRSLGRRTRLPGQYRLRWDEVVYEPGTLEVVTYRKGVKWATDKRCTTGAPVGLSLTADRPTLRADGKDLCFVTIQINDAAGLNCPRANNRLQVTVNGPAELVSMDNGDPTSFESFQSPSQLAFNGLCLAIVRALPGEPGAIEVQVTSDGLVAASLTLRSYAPAAH